MNRLVRLFGSSIGRKIVAATTGALLIAFLLGHMYGNMKVFQGPEALNAYAAWLQGHPLLWAFRAGLLTLFGAHVYLTLTLARDNRAARPVGYRRYRPRASSFFSRYMVLTGLVVLLFVVYHLVHFTFGVIDADHTRLFDAQQRLDVTHRRCRPSNRDRRKRTWSRWCCSDFTSGTERRVRSRRSGCGTKATRR
jgi:succinate dehydrogenase / fumarate reductase cytochrome b subunit